MRAAQLIAPRRFELVELPMPEPAAGQVRIRVEGCGICGSNLAPWQGRSWFTYPFEGGAPGHEGWGEIDALGAGVDGWKIGERVAFLSSNAFAEYDLASAQALVRLEPSLEKKPVPGEALGCAFNVIRRAKIQPGEKVAVVGVGFLGALITRLAADQGGEVIAIGRRPLALEIARLYGAQEVIRMEDHWQIIQQVKDLSAGAGCECVIEATGEQWPLDMAAELTRERGRLVIAGYHQDGPRQVNMQLWNWRGLDVINAHEREARVYVQGMREAVQALASGRLNPAPLFTHSYPLEEINRGFEALENRLANFMKALVTL